MPIGKPYIMFTLKRAAKWCGLQYSWKWRYLNPEMKLLQSGKPIRETQYQTKQWRDGG